MKEGKGKREGKRRWGTRNWVQGVEGALGVGFGMKEICGGPGRNGDRGRGALGGG